MTELTPSDSPDAVPFAVDVHRALADAVRNRPEVAELTAQIAQREIDVTVARDSLKPRLDVVAGYGMRGLAGDQELRGLPIAGLPMAMPASLSGNGITSYSTLFGQKF